MAAGADTNGTQDDNIESNQLFTTWVHSHEESEHSRIVFRANDYSFPPSRGRSAFTLFRDGSVDTGFPGPDDRGARGTGHWQLSGDRLVIEATGWSGDFIVESLQEGRLVLRRQGREK